MARLILTFCTLTSSSVLFFEICRSNSLLLTQDLRCDNSRRITSTSCSRSRSLSRNLPGLSWTRPHLDSPRSRRPPQVVDYRTRGSPGRRKQATQDVESEETKVDFILSDSAGLNRKETKTVKYSKYCISTCCFHTFYVSISICSSLVVMPM